ncbi:MAG: helix-turn-helix transcriptional regulator [Chloroflexi bacterium]|nr:helix-turn-helix transcriptional regulator [Chloroflexota bacterium]
MAVTTKFFRALGDPARLTILESLIERERNVGDLVRTVGLSQGRVSSHLACLNQCGFVKSRRDGKLVYYSIADESVRQLLDVSRAMIAKNAERILACTRVDAT